MTTISICYNKLNLMCLLFHAIQINSILQSYGIYIFTHASALYINNQLCYQNGCNIPDLVDNRNYNMHINKIQLENFQKYIYALKYEIYEKALTCIEGVIYILSAAAYSHYNKYHSFYMPIAVLLLKTHFGPSAVRQVSLFGILLIFHIADSRNPSSLNDLNLWSCD